MGYVPPHIYIVTGDKRFKDAFDKEQRRDAIGIAITGILCFSAIMGGFIYCLMTI